MADEFDPYREALVMETETVWPDEFADRDPADRARIETQLHAEPDKAAALKYIRQHTGFARRITITAADLQRLDIV